jgi:hypothetical protein
MGRKGWVVKEKLQGSGYNLCGVYRSVTRSCIKNGTVLE